MSCRRRPHYSFSTALSLAVPLFSLTSTPIKAEAPFLSLSEVLSQTATTMLRFTLTRALSHVRCSAPSTFRPHALSLRQLTAAASPDPPRANPPSEKDVASSDDLDSETEVNLLEGKKTREALHSTLAARAADAVRYEYFAQRADVEAETEAAPLFRTLSETAKQQAMGYLELLEEYGDADFGSTMQNLEVAAQSERAAADGFLKEAAAVAEKEEFAQMEEWFQDMIDASHRAAHRLEITQAMLEDEVVDGEEVDEEALERSYKS